LEYYDKKNVRDVVHLPSKIMGIIMSVTIVSSAKIADIVLWRGEREDKRNPFVLLVVLMHIFERVTLSDR
jgi:hypothetical protein